MGLKYIIDTNTIIDAQMNRIPDNGINFLKNIINDDFTISFVSYIEFLGFKDITKESQAFIALSNVIEINKKIIDVCIDIRKKHKIKLPDAIIAASALVLNLIIISRNVTDFVGIEDLQVINLYEI